MPISRPFAYNPTLQTDGVSEQFGTLAVGFSGQPYGNQGGLKWWNGPDEELGYTIGTSIPSGGPIAPDGTPSTVGFWRTNGPSESQFVNISNQIAITTFNSYQIASSWLLSNGYWTSSPSTTIMVGGQFSVFSPENNSIRLISLNSDGSYDSTFNTRSGANASVNSILLQSNGQVIISGVFGQYDLFNRSKLARINTDGSGDLTFNIGSGFGSGAERVNASALQTDGKMIFVGNFSTYNSISSNDIVRINTDGTYDSTFTVGTGFNDSGPLDVKIQNDGKILAVGFFTQYSGITTNRIARLNTNGSYDSSFSIGSGLSSIGTCLALQSDQKIIVGGQFLSYSGLTANRIIRLNSNGTVDTSFNAGTGFNEQPNSIDIQSDGKILVGGVFTTFQGSSARKIIRLNSNGSLDSSFSTGEGFNADVNIIKIQNDGKIIVGGIFTSYNNSLHNRICRLNSDGSIDSTFLSGNGFIGSIIGVNTILITPSNKILVGGTFTTYQSTVALSRIFPDTSIDPLFRTGSGFQSFTDVFCCIPQNSGKLLVGGGFGSYNDVAAGRLIRLNFDGSRDNLFNSGGTLFNSTVISLENDSSNRIIVAGRFTTYKSQTENFLIRLNSNSDKDTSFNIGTGFNFWTNSTARQSDGKIIVGGLFTQYQGVTRNRIVRLNTDGSNDPSFNEGTGFNALVNVVKIQPDNKIVVGGLFTTYNEESNNRIIRLNSDGSKDTSFNTGSGFNAEVRQLSIQSDGKILVVGLFSQYSGITSNLIIRLNSDGSHDSTFNVGTGLSGNINRAESCEIQNDGSIYVGGSFLSYSGISVNNVVKLGSNGSFISRIGKSINLTVYVTKPIEINY